MTASRRSPPHRRVHDVLVRHANDVRSNVASLVNAAPNRPRTVQRVLSDIGFPVDIQFQYVAPAPTHVVVGLERRNIVAINIVAVGVEADYARLTSTDPVDRQIRKSVEGDVGVIIHPNDSSLLVAGTMGPALVDGNKASRVAEDITSGGNGPAYHALVDRAGNVSITMGVDDHGSAQPDSETSFDVAFEAAIAVRRLMHKNRQFDGIDSFLELPATGTQLLSLRVLIAKLRTSFPAIPLQLVSSGNGIRYRWPDRFASTGPAPSNFTNEWTRGRLIARPETSFDYASTEDTSFVAAVQSEGPYDLADQVFRPPGQPPATGGRAALATAISELDTAGAQSVALAAYSTLAGHERSAGMQDSARQRFFVQRIVVTHQDADQTVNQATANHVIGSASAPPAATGVEPHTYDYTQGRWVDNGRPV